MDACGARGSSCSNDSPATIREHWRRFAGCWRTQILALLGDAEMGVRDEAISAIEGLLRELEADSPMRAQVAVALMRSTQDPSARVREQAVDALAGFDTPEATAALIQSLGDPEADVREEAIASLARRGDEVAVLSLRAIYEAPDSPHRMDAAIALWQLGDFEPFRREAVTLVRNVTTHEDERERSRAVFLLARVNSDEYRDVIRLAADDPSERVRRSVERALSRRGRGRGR